MRVFFVILLACVLSVCLAYAEAPACQQHGTRNESAVEIQEPRPVELGKMDKRDTCVDCPPEDKAAAVKAAIKWAVLLDEAKYAESWRESAEFFTNVVSRKDWERTAQAVRTPLGKLISRKKKSATYKTAMPGAPDGEYVVIEFNSSFENKKSAIETITPMMHEDGEWRVSGYYIK